MSTDNEDQKVRRIEELEKLLEEHKKEIASLIDQVREVEGAVQTSPNQASKRALDASSHEHEEALGQMSRKLRSLQDGKNILYILTCKNSDLSFRTQQSPGRSLSCHR